MPNRFASATPSTEAMPLSTVTRRSGLRSAASRTISGVSPYPNLKRSGTMKSAFAPKARRARSATAQAVAPSAS